MPMSARAGMDFTRWSGPSRTNRRRRSGVTCKRSPIRQTTEAPRRMERSLLTEAYEHRGHDIEDIVLRGEYLYTANGPGGLKCSTSRTSTRKGFRNGWSARRYRPLGQRTRIHTKYATCIALPSTLALDPARVRDPRNEEQPIDIFYAFVYVSDREEGLVVVNVATLVDGNPGQQLRQGSSTF